MTSTVLSWKWEAFYPPAVFKDCVCHRQLEVTLAKIWKKRSEEMSWFVRKMWLAWSLEGETRLSLALLRMFYSYWVSVVGATHPDSLKLMEIHQASVLMSDRVPHGQKHFSIEFIFIVSFILPCTLPSFHKDRFYFVYENVPYGFPIAPKIAIFFGSKLPSYFSLVTRMNNVLCFCKSRDDFENLL